MFSLFLLSLLSVYQVKENGETEKRRRTTAGLENFSFVNLIKTTINKIENRKNNNRRERDLSLS